MRVAIDATPLILSSGGLARYTRELSQGMARNFPEDEFVLLSDQPFVMPPGSPLNLRWGGGPRGPLERHWWLWGLDRELSRLGADVFHGTNFVVPYLARRPSVLSLHDLSPWMDPAWHHAAHHVRRRTPLLIQMGQATLIMTFSEAVRKQAIERFRIHPSRIVAVPLAASCRFRPVEPRPHAPYFLYVGTLEPRKNVHALVEAWRVVRYEHSVDLVLAGRRRADFAGLEPEPGLEVLGEVPDDELPALYCGALAFVYPSWYEGFALPVLEAMQCGVAVITSKDPAISELVRGAALQVDAEDTRALADCLRVAVTQPERMSKLREQSVARALAFSWARTAALTREVYDEARQRFGF